MPCSSGDDESVNAMIEQLENPTRDPAKSPLTQVQHQRLLLPLLPGSVALGFGLLTQFLVCLFALPPQGKWRLRWSVQAENANFLQKTLADKVQNFQILFTDEEGRSRVENLVDFGPLKIRAEAFCKPASADRTKVDIKRVIFVVGPLQIPFEVNRKRGPDDPVGYVDWLYLDESIRITRGSKGSLFIHTKDE